MSETTAMSTNELTARLQKAENIRARDGVVWKDKFDRTHTIAESRELAEGTAVKLCGRVTALRWLGKLMFGRIYDINGENPPNTFGKDVFTFEVVNDRVLPMGIEGTAEPFNDTTCNKNGRSSGCTAWVLQQENFEYLNLS